MQFIHDSAALIEPYVVEYGLVAIFCLIYLESLGAPLPGESALIAASVMAIGGDFSIAHLLVTVWTAAVIGDSTGYAIGRVGGRPLLQHYGWLVKLTPARLSELEALFRRKGAIIVFGARFVVLLRQLNGLIAGSVAMPFPRFLAANALGAGVWAAFWTLGPYYLGDYFDLRAITSKI